ncbi:MAG: hypothetical protein KJP21_08505, partial [Bacteroidia bacterium]|nr:hypothetical protein [Bacteroidia bacterium]
MRKAIILFFVLLGLQSFSQTLTLDSTESYCQNSGTITVQVDSGNSSFSYEIYNGPTGASAQSYPVTILSPDSTATFYDLIPGFYYLKVVDQDTTLYDSIEVTGAYNEHDFNLGGSVLSCENDSNGMIYVQSSMDGRAPFSYQIIAPDTSAIQTSDTFYNLPIGTYTVRMFDSCTNYQTRDYTLYSDYTPINMWMSGSQLEIGCDSSRYQMRAENGTLPYRYLVEDPTNAGSYIVDTLSNSDRMYVYLPTDYTSSGSATSYKFIVEDNCGEQDFEFDDYYDFGLINVWTSGSDYKEGCDSVWFRLNQDDGTSPYTYSVIDPTNSSNTIFDSTTTESNVWILLPIDFTNSGSSTVYDFVVVDACSKTDTVQDSYDEDEDLYMTSSHEEVMISCDSTSICVGASRGKGPYRYKVEHPSNPGQYIIDTISSSADICLELPIDYLGTGSATNYTFWVYDDCGDSATVSNKHENYISTSDNGYCGYQTVTLGGSWSRTQMLDSFYFELTPDTLGIGNRWYSSADKSISYLIKWDTFPLGSYDWTVITQCNDTFTGNIEEHNWPLDSIEVEWESAYCGVEQGHIDVEVIRNPNTPMGPYYYRLYQNGNVIDSIMNTNDRTKTFSDIDNGTYTVQVTNVCGDVVEQTVTLTGGVTMTLSNTTVPGCGLGDSKIELNVTTNLPSGDIQYNLYDSTGKYLKDQTTNVFYNLYSEKYIVGISSKNHNCMVLEDTVVIPEYKQPEIDAKSLGCTNGTISINASASFGVAPYTYWLRDQDSGFAVIRGPVSYDTFIGLSISTNYNVLVEDACGNTANAGVSPYTPEVNLISKEGDNCRGQFIKIGTDTMLQSQFSWTGPNGFTRNGRRIKFHPVTASNAGEYILTANILGGCLVLKDTFEIFADTATDAYVYPITGSCLFDSARLDLRGNSPLSSETGKWTIVSAPFGANYSFIDQSDSVTSLITDMNGTYVLRWTIKTARNCKSYSEVSYYLDCNPNQITGTVYYDKDADQSLDAGEKRTKNVLVHLYDDVNHNGILETGEAISIDSVLTNGSGFYVFNPQFSGDTASYIINVDTLTLPSNASLTTDNIEVASFTSGGNVDANNDFGHNKCWIDSGISSPSIG